MIRFLNFFLTVYFLLTNIVLAEIVKSIDIKGNDRISKSTILMFSNVEINNNLSDTDINSILKNLYQTNFFQNVEINFKENILFINVIENPLIQNIAFEGIKADKIKNLITSDLKLKARSSFVLNHLNDDIKFIENQLKSLGYYFSKISTIKELNEDNTINLIYKIDLGEKAKIKKISFIGNKVFKDNKLKSVIISEEYKFWKFISGKKYLNENISQLDVRLLKNFYLNNGYYNVEINTSFAKLLNNDEFELIFNINANDKIKFNNFTLNLPDDFNPSNFLSLEKVFNDLKGKNYSILSVQQILNEIDELILIEEYESISANVDEQIIGNKIDITFNVTGNEKIYLKKINIYGNNITKETVIRNQLLIDEGDPFNEILVTKSINRIKALNFFREVNYNIEEIPNENSNIINLFITEKPTGEIFAGAGFGSSGGTFTFGLKENNYLGQGIKFDGNITVDTESINGLLSISNPNYKNSDKSVSFSVEADETDRLIDNGYKTNKTGFALNTNFEYKDDLFLGLGSNIYYEKIEASSLASLLQKKQAGNYFDTFINFSLDYDKRNQKFQTSDGFRSIYNLNLPIISDSNTLTNVYSYKTYGELFENNISTFSYYFKSANSLSGDNIKLSERVFLPSNRLRGFESGKIGPKDGTDYIGGNFVSSVNLTSTIPQIFPNYQNADFILFFDAANIWGIDYDSTLGENSVLRSSVGMGIDWLSPVGPFNFSIAYPISKANTDITESFRFNLGTTF